MVLYCSDGLTPPLWANPKEKSLAKIFLGFQSSTPDPLSPNLAFRGVRNPTSIDSFPGLDVEPSGRLQNKPPPSRGPEPFVPGGGARFGPD